MLDIFLHKDHTVAFGNRKMVALHQKVSVKKKFYHFYHAMETLVQMRHLINVVTATPIQKNHDFLSIIAELVVMNHVAMKTKRTSVDNATDKVCSGSKI